MFKRFRLWLTNRKVQAAERRYNDGFGWVMVAYYMEGLSMDELEAYIYYPYDEPNEFEKGGSQALWLIHRIEADERVDRYAVRRFLDWG